jgi:hypothetical protein
VAGNVVYLMLNLWQYFKIGHRVVFQANNYTITVDTTKYVSV